ncbi:MarR family winged helix-turn-helix transcriptional regulator [Paenibacillus sp. NPDC058071]|uniref:MarR family winged helix-turn-helix transcriptional regulator n=1 Tax=Paenibacillus sp. NPDC058071 TaxID=3346326 RepID=UPI0036DAA464
MTTSLPENGQPAQPTLTYDDSFTRTCLYFTTNRLSRAITRMADDAFAPTGLTPAYGYVVRLVIGKPGITQKELSDTLSIAPSTLTRFIDKLEVKKLVERKGHGKTVLVYPTDKGNELGPSILEASKRLKKNYEEVLGKDVAAMLTSNQEQMSDLMERS